MNLSGMVLRDERFLAEIEVAAEQLSRFAHTAPQHRPRGDDLVRRFFTHHPLDPRQSLREQYDCFAQWARSQQLLPESMARFSAHVLRRTVVLALGEGDLAPV